MNFQNCDDIKAVLLDYTEREVSAAEQKQIADHLAVCENCNKEYQGLHAMLNKAKTIPINDPGEGFWRQLPQKVLQEVMQERAKLANAKVINLPGKRQAVNQPFIGENKQMREAVDVASGTSRSHQQNRGFIPALAIAATLLLAINVMVFTPNTEYLWFDQGHFQAQINYADGLGVLAQKVSAKSRDAVRMGFVEQQASVNNYRIGSLLAESFVYVRANGSVGSDFDNNAMLLKQKLQQLYDQLQNANVSAVTSSSIRQAMDLLQAANSSNKRSNDKYDHEALAKLLSIFQHDYENYLIRTKPQQLPIYRSGIWVFNMDLAAAANQSELIRREINGEQLSYLQNSFYRLKAPVGIQKSLQEIAIIIDGGLSSEKDLRSLRQELHNLRVMLG
jgi:hypothetical protein